MAERRPDVEAAVLIMLRDCSALSMADMLGLLEMGWLTLDDAVSPEDLVDAFEHLAGRGLIGQVWSIASTDGHDAAERAVAAYCASVGGVW